MVAWVAHPRTARPERASLWPAALGAALLAMLILWAGHAFAQPAEKRVALVIGNAGYRHTAALANPVNDAKDVAAALREAGFEVTEGLDLDKQGMDVQLARFARSAEDASAAVIFYAGHGLQYQGRNYLVPVDAKLEDEIGIQFETTVLEDLMSAFVRVKGVQILIIDACRNNPLASRLAEQQIDVGTGLSRISSPRGMLVASATQANEVAFDGKGRNSFFTAALVNQLKVPGVEIHEMFRRVAAEVNDKTGGKQLPETSSSLGAAFFVNPGETDELAWAKLRESSDVRELRAFVERFPDSLLADAAAARIELIERIASERDLQQQLAAAEQAAQPPAAPAEPAPAEATVAAVDPVAPPPEVPGEEPESVVLVREAQTELARIGCYAEAPNGIFDARTRDALSAYFGQIGEARPARIDAIDGDLVRQLREAEGTECRLAAAAPPAPPAPAPEAAADANAGAGDMPSCDVLQERAQLGEVTEEVMALIQKACR